MPPGKMRMSVLQVCMVILFILTIFNYTVAQSQPFVQSPSSRSAALNLKVSGDAQKGFEVDIYNDGRLLVTHSSSFTLQLFNTDLTTTANLTGWKGKKWTGDKNRIVLTGDSYIPEFDANLSIKVIYEIVNQHTLKRTLSLFQPSMPDMYYILKEKARPAGKPLKYVTFEQDSFPGGLIHEMYPAAGWVTQDNQAVGFLTDAGYKNQYTRTTRRRFSGRGGGFTGMRKLPDPALFSVASPAERKEDNDYVQLTYGEMYNLDAGTTIPLQPLTPWHKIGQAGMEAIAPFKDQHVYTISFLCKGNPSLALKLFRISKGLKTAELENGLKYIDNFPVVDTTWTLFKGSIFVPYIEQDSVSLFIGPSSSGKLPETTSGISQSKIASPQKAPDLQIKDLKIEEHIPASEPYNLLAMGEWTEKTDFIFVEPWTGHQQFMISAQSRLAEAKGFKGSQIEKMLYANFNMLTWITTVNDFTPFNVPNMNYAPDMYNRDSYFSTVSTYNKKLNLAIWDQWGKTQTAAGGIGTIITPYMGSVEAKDNEATIEWLIWALLNKRRFGVILPQEKIKKAVDYVLNKFDSLGDGICRSHFPMSQIDIIDYDPKTDRLAVNQGMLAIALRTIRELGFPVTEAHIQKAENGYRAFYDPKSKHLLFDRNFPDIISLTDLEPEFFSLWLFKRPILTDSMVTNQLDHFPLMNKVAGSPHPEYGTTAPICIRVTSDQQGYAYLSRDYQPFAKFGEENYSDGSNDGFYYNGGSWMRAEYCAYVTGLRHGWKKARPLMENRIWAEIYLHPEWPFSKEFIPTKWTTTDSWWPSTKGLCWNVFILMADEVAGLRTPDMDPDYHNSKNN
ncbi:hypothetical protein ACX0G9_15060 [Flavitalea flava]